MSAVDNHAGPIGEVRRAGVASGVALTATAALTAFPTGTTYLTLLPRNAATAVVVRYALNPYLVVLKATDLLATIAAITDVSENMQDADTATLLTLDSFDTIANLDAIYVGSHIPFRGVDVVGGNFNGTSSVLTVKYWNGSSWTDISDTDGTISSGATFGQNGQVTWTLPSAWVARTLVDIGDATPLGGLHLADPLYWTRWEVSVALDSSVTVTAMLALNRSTNYAEFPVNIGKELRVHKGRGGIGCIEALTNAGTANLVIEAAALGVGGKFKD